MKNSEGPYGLDRIELEVGVNNAKSPELPLFSLDILRFATGNFSMVNKVGQGGLGPAYKGELPNGQEIAVKRLSKVSGQGLQEFRNEVIVIAKLQHRNLVRLLGYCIQDPINKVRLDWKKCFDIIEGIAQGLLYLHRDSLLRIVHRDLKASNILLDEEMDPKISDFGTTRIYGGKDYQENTVKSGWNLVKCYFLTHSNVIIIIIITGLDPLNTDNYLDSNSPIILILVVSFVKSLYLISYLRVF